MVTALTRKTQTQEKKEPTKNQNLKHCHSFFLIFLHLYTPHSLSCIATSSIQHNNTTQSLCIFFILRWIFLLQFQPLCCSLLFHFYFFLSLFFFPPRRREKKKGLCSDPLFECPKRFCFWFNCWGFQYRGEVQLVLKFEILASPHFA